MWQNDSEAASPASRARAGARVPAATTAVARERRRAFKRLRLHRQFVPLLVIITLLSTAGIAGLAYIGSRSAAISTAQTRAAQDAQVLREELTARGDPLRLSDGRFVVGSGPDALTLNNDATIVDHAHALLGADVTIYELEDSHLVAVSTTLPAAGAPHGARDLGDALPAGITSVLLGSCGPAAPSSCYRSYDGQTTIAGRQYVMDAVPLFDATGTFVGAVGAALPLDSVLASTVQLSVILLLVGAVLALGSLAAGTWIYGARVESVLDRLDGRLNRLADAAGNLEYLAHIQGDRSGRQSAVARQIAEQVRALDSMAQVMEQGHAALRDSTSEIWSEISQPGMALDSATTTRLAQQTAIASARVGSAAADARDLCRQLVAQMNHIVAEAGIATDSGQALEQSAQDVRACVEGVEITLGERLRNRVVGASFPLIRRVRAASQHVRKLLPAWAVPAAGMSASAHGISETSAAPATTQSDNDRSRGAQRRRQAGAARHDASSAAQQAPVDPSFGPWRSSTGRHVTPPYVSPGTGATHGAPSGSLPGRARSPYDNGHSNDGRGPDRPRTSGWLGE